MAIFITLYYEYVPIGNEYFHSTSLTWQDILLSWSYLSLDQQWWAVNLWCDNISFTFCQVEGKIIWWNVIDVAKILSRLTDWQFWMSKLSIIYHIATHIITHRHNLSKWHLTDKQHWPSYFIYFIITNDIGSKFKSVRLAVVIDKSHDKFLDYTLHFHKFFNRSISNCKNGIDILVAKWLWLLHTD